MFVCVRLCVCICVCACECVLVVLLSSALPPTLCGRWALQQSPLLLVLLEFQSLANTYRINWGHTEKRWRVKLTTVLEQEKTQHIGNLGQWKNSLMIGQICLKTTLAPLCEEIYRSGTRRKKMLQEFFSLCYAKGYQRPCIIHICVCLHTTPPPTPLHTHIIMIIYAYCQCQSFNAKKHSDLPNNHFICSFACKVTILHLVTDKNKATQTIF